MHSFLHLLLQYNHSIHKSIRWLYWTEFRTSWVAWRRHLDTITQLLTGVRVHFQNVGDWLVLICGIYCIEVAIHLVPKGEPSLLGKICLRTTQAAPTVALTDCRCCWAETWLWLCFWYRRFCFRRTLSVLASLFAASVEGEAQEYLHTHSSRGHNFREQSLGTGIWSFKCASHQNWLYVFRLSTSRRDSSECFTSQITAVPQDNECWR